MEMTLEQKRAIAMANARRRMASETQADDTSTLKKASGIALDSVEAIGTSIKNLVTASMMGAAKLSPDWVRKADEKVINWIADNTGLIEKLPEGGLDQVEQEKVRELISDPAVQFSMGVANTTMNIIDKTMGTNLIDRVKAYEEQEGIDSAAKEIGKFADPVLWKVAGLASKVMPYQKVLGQGIKEGVKAFTKNVGAGAATGAATGALSPDATIEEGAMLGAGISTAAMPVLGGAGKILEKGKQLAIEPFTKKGAQMAAGRTAAAVAGDKKQEIVEALKRAPKGVSAGQAATGTGSAEFAGLQKIADTYKPTPAKALESSQIARRQQALQRGTPNLQKAIDLRASQSIPIQEEALRNAGSLSPLKSKTILSEIDELFTKPRSRTYDIVKDTRSYLKDKIKSRTKKDGTIDAQDLYGIRETIGIDIRGIVNSKNRVPSKGKVAELTKEVQLVIDDAIEKSGGDRWKEYLDTYSQLSRPIEQSKIMSEMSGAIKGPGGTERPNAFLNLIGRGEERLYKKGTDYAPYSPEKMDQLLSPSQKRLRDVVTAQLERDIQLKNLAKAGKPEAARIMGMAEEPVTANMPNWLNPKVTFTRSLANRLAGKGGEKAREELAAMMIENPKLLGQMMEAQTTPYSNKVIEALLQSRMPQAYAPLLGGE